VNINIVKYASACIQHTGELRWNKSQSANILVLGRKSGLLRLLGAGRNPYIYYQFWYRYCRWLSCNQDCIFVLHY